MPVAPEEILKELQKATAEARRATSDAHAATKQLRQAVKDERNWMREEITREVKEAIEAIRADTTEQMQNLALSVVDEISASWKAKLGF